MTSLWPMREGPDVSDSPGSLRYLVLYGSHAHGTNTPTSDEDWRGVYQLPTDAFLVLDQPKTTWERKADDIVLWELAHFCKLLLQGNPNIVGMLFVPPEMVSRMEWPVQQLYNMRRDFISRSMVSAYRGWVHTELRVGESLTPKRASHLLRLLWGLDGALRDGDIPVRLPDDLRGRVMDVKTGRTPVPEALGIVREELRRVDSVVDSMDLKDPPRDKVRALLIEARHRDLGMA